jgi:hypothetical protein
MPTPPVDTPHHEPVATVRDLLALSRAAHQRYRSCLPTLTQGRYTNGDMRLAKEALKDAKRLREAAHALDPAHADEAWLQDVGSHAELMAFYRMVGDA